jgi:phage recombination protein Bet
VKNGPVDKLFDAWLKVHPEASRRAAYGAGYGEGAVAVLKGARSLPGGGTMSDTLKETSMAENQTLEFTPLQMDLIRKTLCPHGISDSDFQLFIETAKRKRLDPFSRQIYVATRRTKNNDGTWNIRHVPEATIDGFRAIAQRTGEYQGQTGPYWCGKDGVWKDVWTADEPPAAAKIGALRKGFLEPLVAVADWKGYVQTTTQGVGHMWKKLGPTMLAKCAEALALRRAFPDELGGIYTTEEMMQAGSRRLRRRRARRSRRSRSPSRRRRGPRLRRSSRSARSSRRSSSATSLRPRTSRRPSCWWRRSWRSGGRRTSPRSSTSSTSTRGRRRGWGRRLAWPS